jgi:26S proteasome regulatory subunit N2
MLALLDEPNDLLKAAALKNLDLIVDQFWADISAALLKIEALYDDDEFTERQLAASVASKVFYHLEQLDEALRYALRAGDRFSVEDQSQYAQTLVSKCIDEYIRLRSSALDTNDAKGLSDADLKIEPRLVAVVESMFARCFADRQFKQAIGVAIDSRRLDVVVEAIKASGQRAEMLEHVVNLARTVVSSRVYRHQILATAVKCYRDLGVADYSAICQSLLFLDDAAEVAVTLDTLLQSSDETVALSALQVAFDLHENLNMPFLMRVVEALPSPDVQVVDIDTPLLLYTYTTCAVASSVGNSCHPNLLVSCHDSCAALARAEDFGSGSLSRGVAGCRQ